LEWQLTKRLRQIRNARHFQFALNLVFTAQWFRLGGNVAHYLTRRYVSKSSRDTSTLPFLHL
ncbi:hypothetical protein, partial [Vibrio salilacus]|uniref:hypothetical protein n=1 Tax=Vibrio salilacus TaxID=1323749 RepID=UPI000C2AE816